MAIKGVSHRSYKGLGEDTIKKISNGKIPQSTIIICNFNCLSRLAQGQIEIHLHKILLHPEKKELYVDEINKIILYEKERGLKKEY